MRSVARICYRHFLAQSNVLFVIDGKSNNTGVHETLRAMGDALREHFSTHGPTPLYVVVGRGGPNLPIPVTGQPLLFPAADVGDPMALSCRSRRTADI